MKKAAVFLLSVFLFVGCSSAPKTPDLISQQMRQQVEELSSLHALVVALPSGRISVYDGNGLQPMFDALTGNGVKDAYVYDKVTGRASALLLAYGGAKELHTGMISQEALPILKKYNIKYTAHLTVPYILNRDKTGSCPMENVARELDDAQQAYPLLKEGFEKFDNPAQ